MIVHRANIEHRQARARRRNRHFRLSELWKTVDPDPQPIVEEARRRAQRLSGEAVPAASLMREQRSSNRA